MSIARKSWSYRRLEGLSVLLSLVLAAGCARPSELPSDDGATQADQQKLPFQGNGAKLGSAGEATGEQAANREARAASSAPFQNPGSVAELPAGTLLTVRLEKQISKDRVGDEATFAAVLDEPVLMDGKVAVPRGATVTGRMESARASDVGPGHGYIRLTLDTITIAGKRLPLRTSSLFVRGSAGELSSGSGQNEADSAGPTVTRMQKGHRLTFRLAAMVPLYGQGTVSSGQNHTPGTE